MSDADDLVEFYNPHPGLMGCLAPLPGMVREIVKGLDGTRGSVASAARKIVEAAGGEPYHARVSARVMNEGKLDQTGFIYLSDGTIAQHLADGRPVNSWAVIHFRPARKEQTDE